MADEKIKISDDASANKDGTSTKSIATVDPAVAAILEKSSKEVVKTIMSVCAYLVIVIIVILVTALDNLGALFLNLFVLVILGCMITYLYVRLLFSLDGKWDTHSTLSHWVADSTTVHSKLVMILSIPTAAFLITLLADDISSNKDFSVPKVYYFYFVMEMLSVACLPLIGLFPLEGKTSKQKNFFFAPESVGFSSSITSTIHLIAAFVFIIGLTIVNIVYAYENADVDWVRGFATLALITMVGFAVLQFLINYWESSPESLRLILKGLSVCTEGASVIFAVVMTCLFSLNRNPQVDWI